MNHDAAMAVVDYSSGIGEVLWAAHAERYSKVKNDHFLNQAIVDEAMTFGPFDKVVFILPTSSFAYLVFTCALNLSFSNRVIEEKRPRVSSTPSWSNLLAL